MIDIVFPRNNEAQFIDMAKQLGYSSLCFVYDSVTLIPKSEMQLYKGVLAKSNVNRFRKADLILIKTSDARKAVEKLKPDIIYGLEENQKSDFIHQRNSGLNQILCRFAKDNGVAIGFSVSSILNARKPDRIMGRMTQNIKMCRKFGLMTVTGSFATQPYHMRAPCDIKSLFITLGMHQKEAKDALMNAHSIIKKNIQRKSPKYISDGVEYV